MNRKLILLYIIFTLGLSFTVHAGESIDVNIDKDLKATWVSMINKLSAGDIEGALKYITYSSRWKYKKQFASVKDNLPEIASKIRKIEPVYIKDYEAKYRARIGNQDDEYTHYIWFRKDIFGFWKIEKF